MNAYLKVVSILPAIWFGLALFLPAQDLATATPREVGLSTERLQRIDEMMTRMIDKGKAPGVVALVARQGKIAYLKSFGQLDSNRPMPTDAIFRIASQTKAITTAAVMILLEEGKLLLSDPISLYIPEFKDSKVAIPEGDSGYRVEPAKREITIKDLLTHTSGISYGYNAPAEEEYRKAGTHGWFFADQDRTIGDAIRALARVPFDAHPGEKYIYGFNTDILGHIVEKASGMTLEDFFEERILEPLGMEDTHFYLPVEKSSRFTPVFGAKEDGTIELIESATDNSYVEGPRRAFSGGAGLLSTATDYARFLQMLLNGGRFNGSQILSPKSVELMTADHVGELYGTRGFGFGFWVNEGLGQIDRLGSVGAYGWGGAYYTTYWVDPAEELVAVMMTQLRPSGGIGLQERFNNLVYQSIVRSGQEPQ